MIELKPCPFCGGDAEMQESDDASWVDYRVFHFCMARANTYKIYIMTNWCSTPEQAAEVWNERSEEA